MKDLDPRQAAETIQKRADQTEFAAIVALTWTAKNGQAMVKDSLRARFILRNTWTERGIRITPATKTKPEADVYSKDEYIAHQEKGGIRARRFPAYIPIRDSIQQVLGVDKKKVIPKGLRAKQLLAKKNHKGKPVYQGKSKAGNDVVFIGRGNDKRGLYVVRRSPVHNPKNPWFYVVMVKAYDDHYDKNFEAAKKKFVK